MIYFIVRGLAPLKDKPNVQNVHVSLSLPCPRVLLIVTTVQSPDTVAYFTFLYGFRTSFTLALVCFNRHVDKDFLQHGLGTPYSNSACFDKEDIWNFCSFLYSACQFHLF